MGRARGKWIGVKYLPLHLTQSKSFGAIIKAANRTYTFVIYSGRAAIVQTREAHAQWMKCAARRIWPNIFSGNLPSERGKKARAHSTSIHIVGRRRRRNDDGQAECVNNVPTRTNSLASLFLGCSTFHRMMKRNLIESAFRRPKKSRNRFVLHSHTALFTHTRALWSAI